MGKGKKINCRMALQLQRDVSVEVTQGRRVLLFTVKILPLLGYFRYHNTKLLVALWSGWLLGDQVFVVVGQRAATPKRVLQRCRDTPPDGTPPVRSCRAQHPACTGIMILRRQSRHLPSGSHLSLHSQCYTKGLLAPKHDDQSQRYVHFDWNA